MCSRWTCSARTRFRCTCSPRRRWQLYREHLAPHGVLALHISNVHLDLVPITLAHARAFGMHATRVVDKQKGDGLSSTWVILSPDAEFSWGRTFRRRRAP